MNRTIRLACVLVIAMLTLGLTVSSPASAASAPPLLASQAGVRPDTEAIPPAVLTDPAIDTLDRMIFRYETVHFSVDSSALLPGGREALQRKVRWLLTHPAATVIVEGHCDARGSSAYNQQLGARRAEAVRTFLVEQGIEPHRVRIVSWGKERPGVAGSGEKAWSHNRRAEFLPR